MASVNFAGVIVNPDHPGNGKLVRVEHEASKTYRGRVGGSHYLMVVPKQDVRSVPVSAGVASWLQAAESYREKAAECERYAQECEARAVAIEKGGPVSVALIGYGHRAPGIVPSLIPDYTYAAWEAANGRPSDGS